MNKMKRVPLVAAVVAVALASGCMGSFGLTRMIYGWNEKVTDNKIINNVIFWVLGILPVYSIAMGVDLIILNTVEFWTGNKLIADGTDGTDANGKAERVVVNQHDDGSVTIVRGDQVFTLVPDGEDRVTIVIDGEVKGTATRQVDGSVVAADVDGNVVASQSAEQASVEQGRVAAVLAAN